MLRIYTHTCKLFLNNSTTISIDYSKGNLLTSTFSYKLYISLLLFPHNAAGNSVQSVIYSLR